jgi:hypothetical protein
LLKSNGGAPPPSLQRHEDLGQFSPGGISFTTHVTPENDRSDPPKPQSLKDSLSPSDPWTIDNYKESSYCSPARSSSSQHTAKGPDYEYRQVSQGDNKQQATSQRIQNENPRKRSYGDVEEDDDHNGRQRRLDYPTPRSKKRQPRIAAAYRLVLNSRTL